MTYTCFFIAFYSPTVPSPSRSIMYLYSQWSEVIGMEYPAALASEIVTVPFPFVSTDAMSPV